MRGRLRRLRHLTPPSASEAETQRTFATSPTEQIKPRRTLTSINITRERDADSLGKRFEHLSTIRRHCRWNVVK